VSARPGVLGLGLIGGSLLKGLAAVGIEAVGADADPAVAGAARAAGFHVVPDAAALARACDVVVVCVPPARVAESVLALLEADAGVVAADAASVKAPVLRAVSAAADAAALDRYVPAHPLAGSERAGWDASEPALLRDAVWAVCPPAAGAGLASLCTLAAALEPLSPRLLACDADTHDAALARTSHVPHVAAQALARLPTATGLPLSAALSGGAYRDMTRIARSDAALWLDIVGANRVATAAGLRALIAGLAELADAVESGDDAALAEAWRTGAATRATVDAVRWRAPEWRAHRVAGTGWDGLLELGRAGVLVRRLRQADGGLELEASG
jgi:prephenate dehydrogenase